MKRKDQLFKEVEQVNVILWIDQIYDLCCLKIDDDFQSQISIYQSSKSDVCPPCASQMTITIKTQMSVHIFRIQSISHWGTVGGVGGGIGLKLLNIRLVLGCTTWALVFYRYCIAWKKAVYFSIVEVLLHTSVPKIHKNPHVCKHEKWYGGFK